MLQGAGGMACRLQPGLECCFGTQQEGGQALGEESLRAALPRIQSRAPSPHPQTPSETPQTPPQLPKPSPAVSPGERREEMTAKVPKEAAPDGLEPGMMVRLQNGMQVSARPAQPSLLFFSFFLCVWGRGQDWAKRSERLLRPRTSLPLQHHPPTHLAYLCRLL